MEWGAGKENQFFGLFNLKNFYDVGQHQQRFNQ